jgi:hypothetical protein
MIATADIERWQVAFEGRPEGFCDIGQWGPEVKKWIERMVRQGKMGRYQDLNSFPRAKRCYYLIRKGGAE